MGNSFTEQHGMTGTQQPTKYEKLKKNSSELINLKKITLNSSTMWLNWRRMWIKQMYAMGTVLKKCAVNEIKKNILKFAAKENLLKAEKV